MMLIRWHSEIIPDSPRFQRQIFLRRVAATWFLSDYRQNCPNSRFPLWLRNIPMNNSWQIIITRQIEGKHKRWESEEICPRDLFCQMVFSEIHIRSITIFQRSRNNKFCNDQIRPFQRPENGFSISCAKEALKLSARGKMFSLSGIIKLSHVKITSMFTEIRTNSGFVIMAVLTLVVAFF